jgi:hypothetical protein
MTGVLRLDCIVGCCADEEERFVDADPSGVGKDDFEASMAIVTVISYA